MAFSLLRGACAATVLTLAAAACGGHTRDTRARARAGTTQGEAEVAISSADATRWRALDEVPVRSRFQLTFDVANRTLHPDDVRVVARFTAPSGVTLQTGGFASHGRHVVRFTPREVGAYRYVIQADGGHGMRDEARGTLEVTSSPSSSPRAGFVARDPKDPHRLVRDDGSPVYVLGENRINVYDPAWNFEGVDTPTYLARMAGYGMSTIRVFVFADCESETTAGGYQIGCLEPGIGRFDEKTADALDVLFDAADKSGIDVVLVAYAIGFTPGAETWRSWADNPYSVHRDGPLLAPEELFTSPAMRAHAARKLRYIADRWAYSPRLLAIDLLNEPEWDGPIAEAAWLPWAEAMSEAWRTFDPYRHLVTTGSVGLQSNIGPGDERPWYASPRNDMVQWHLYGKEFYPPYPLALEMRRKVEETWSFDKPVVCGEFAYGGEDKKTYDHTHNGIWSLLLSGAGALAHTAPTFQLDSDEPMTEARGAHFRVLSELLRSFGKRALSRRRDVRVARGGGHAWSLASDDGRARALWVLGPEAGYGKPVSGLELTMPAPPEGRYALTWLDDTTGEILAKAAPTSTGSGELVVPVPRFTRHVAARMLRE